MVFPSHQIAQWVKTFAAKYDNCVHSLGLMRWKESWPPTPTYIKTNRQTNKTLKNLFLFSIRKTKTKGTKWRTTLYQRPHSHHTWVRPLQYIGETSSEKLLLATDNRDPQLENMQSETLKCCPHQTPPLYVLSMQKRRKEDCKNQGCWVIRRQQYFQKKQGRSTQNKIVYWVPPQHCNCYSTYSL